MMPFIPAALLMTLVIGFVSFMATESGRFDASQTLGDNLRFWHERAVRQVITEGAIPGFVFFDHELPFENMAGWTSAVLDVNGRILVATWPAAYTLGGSPETLPFAADDYRRALHRIDQDVRAWGFKTRTGIFSVHGDDTEWVGYLDVTDMALPLQDGATLVVTEFE